MAISRFLLVKNPFNIGCKLQTFFWQVTKSQKKNPLVVQCYKLGIFLLWAVGK